MKKHVSKEGLSVGEWGSRWVGIVKDNIKINPTLIALLIQERNRELISDHITIEEKGV